MGFYCLNCFYFCRRKSKCESLEKVCENKDFCNLIMPPEDTRSELISKISYKVSFLIYTDLECLTERIDECKNNPENSSTRKVSKHIPSGFSMPTISSFKRIKIKHDPYRGKDCIKKFCESFGEYTMKIMFKKKKMKLLTKEQYESYKHEKTLYLYRKM